MASEKKVSFNLEINNRFGDGEMTQMFFDTLAEAKAYVRSRVSPGVRYWIIKETTEVVKEGIA